MQLTVSCILAVLLPYGVPSDVSPRHQAFALRECKKFSNICLASGMFF